jgi:hypothetical protein
MIFTAAATLVAYGLPRGEPTLQSWQGDFVAVYPDGSESLIENEDEIRTGEQWGTSSYVIARLEWERRGSATGDRVRAILALPNSR